MNKRFVILGATGMLGRCVSRYLNKRFRCVKLDRTHFNASEYKQAMLEDVIGVDDVVINCVGVLKPYITSNNTAEVVMINTVFPLTVDGICKANNARMIHISSDCIFSGNRGEYTETCIPDATDTYGMTKSFCPPDAITLRTSFIGEQRYSAQFYGLLQWVINNNHSTIDGYTNCIWNGVTCLQLAKTIEMLSTNELLYINGVRHVHSPCKVSKYDLCKLIKKTYNLDIKINKTNTDSITGSVITNTLDRSLHSIYNDINMTIPELEEQLVEERELNLS